MINHIEIITFMSFIYLESQADDALLARLSYAASLRAQENALKAANKLPMKEIARIALLFCIMVSLFKVIFGMHCILFLSYMKMYFCSTSNLRIYSHLIFTLLQAII